MDVTDVTDLYQEFGDERLPPGQRETSAFPVLSKSGTPDWDPETWEFTVTGAVDEELSVSWDEFRELPSVTQRQDFHCVTGWSKFDCEFTGVPFPELAERAGVHDDAVHVMFSALDDYTTDLPLADCMREEVLFTWRSTATRSPRTTAGRSASSRHTGTPTRARSGSTGSSSSPSPNVATGSGEATRRRRTRGRRNGTVSTPVPVEE